jgi:serine/threonine protein kinase
LASLAFYRVPELFLGSHACDGGVDTWVLGCIMAELLAGMGGIPFFFHESEADVFWCIVFCESEPKQVVSLRERYARDTSACNRSSLTAGSP